MSSVLWSTSSEAPFNGGRRGGSGGGTRWRHAALLVLTGLLAVACSSAPRPADEAGRQLGFGVEMARQGLWREALFRFEAADRLQPGDPETLNNMAVAFEAVGRYEEALETYREALERAPGNRNLKANYQHFTEFYQNFRPDQGEEPAEAGDAEGGSES